MNKRIISMMLVLTMLVGIAEIFAVPTDATATLTITQPYDGEWISYSNSPRLEWNKVDGAARYRISIRNLETDELVVDRAWTTKTYYTLKGKLDAAAAEYRIWVGAMYSKNDDNLSSFTSSTITVHTTPEAPEIDGETWEDTTYNSVVLSMDITKNNGNAITDSGFYIVESSLSTSDRIKYSFKNYGSYSATTKGYKAMTITGLKPDTKYYFWAYAINGVGETISSRHTVTTDEYNCPHTSGVYTNTYPESVSYINIDDSKQHKEIWYYHHYCQYCNKIVKEKAVEEINYANHQFADGVCELCKYEKPGSAKFDSAPTLSLSIDGNKISGDIYGTYIPGDVIYLNITANYSDHMFVEASSSLLTFTNPEGTVYSSGTFVEKTSSSAYTPKYYTNGSAFQIAINVPEGIPAGDYTISVTATDGVYDGDSGSIAGTSYYDSVKKSVTVRIGEKTNSGSSSVNVTADDVITYAEKHLGKKSGNNEFFKWTVDWCGYFVGWVGRNAGANFPTKDSQCANGRALTAWFVNNDAGTFYYFRSKNYDSLISQETISEKGKRLCQLSTRDEFIPQPGDIIIFLWSDSEAQGYNWSHVGFVKNYNSSTKTIYTIEGNTTSDPQVANRTRTYGSEVVAFIRPNYATENIHTQSYTITYNYNHEGGSIKTETKNHDEVYTISNTIIPTCPSTETNTTITSYSFEGWATSEYGDVIYQPGDTYTQNSNLTLYAQWTASISNKPQADVTVYGIFYDANGGSNAPEASSGVKAGTTITLSTARPTRSGYTFIGWSLDKNDDAADYQPGDSYTVTGATTLYAVWEPIAPSCEHINKDIISSHLSCQVEGYIIYQCNDCGNQLTLVASKVDHSYTEGHCIYCYQPHPDCTNGHEFGAWTKNTINDIAPHISLCIKCQYPSYSQHDFYSTADYDGNYHVRNCTLCGAVYEEHDYMYIEGWAASCKDNSTGRKACNQCTLCDRLILNGEQVRQEDLIIYPTHSVQHVEAQNPTCTTDGNIEYWYCTECNQTWLDKDCTLLALSTVSPSPGHVWDSGIVTNGNILYTCTVCHTTQTETAPQNSPTISIESARGSAGNTVTMQVFIANNPGIAFLSLSLQYDQSVLTLASKAINGEIISDLDHGTNLMWTSPYNSNANGLLCTLTFNISSNAVAGNYPISLIFREAYTEDEKKVSFSISNGSVQVFEYIYGDVNGDEIVDGRDVIKLRQYMANYNYDTGISTVTVSAGADANGDGIINGLDVIKLRQYMANYNYDTGSSTVILGPTQ